MKTSAHGVDLIKRFEGVNFTVAFVIGAKGKANIYLPDNKHHYFETPEEGAL